MFFVYHIILNANEFVIVNVFFKIVRVVYMAKCAYVNTYTQKSCVGQTFFKHERTGYIGDITRSTNLVQLKKHEESHKPLYTFFEWFSPRVFIESISGNGFELARYTQLTSPTRIEETDLVVYTSLALG